MKNISPLTVMITIILSSHVRAIGY
ncbi:thr operon leader peptide [Sodalis glossinidius]